MTGINTSSLSLLLSFLFLLYVKYTILLALQGLTLACNGVKPLFFLSQIQLYVVSVIVMNVNELIFIISR